MTPSFPTRLSSYLQVDRIFDRPLGNLFRFPWPVREADLRVAVAVDQPVDMLEQIGPHRLRAGIAAPRASDRAGDEEQPDPRHDEQARDIIEFMRPYPDLEHVETPVRQVDEHRLVGRVRPATPSNPGRSVIDRQGDRHDRPFEAPERAVHLLGVDALSRRIERPMRSEEHTSELQSLMRTPYAGFCLKKKKQINNRN